MSRLAFLKKKWVLTLLALVLLSSGIGAYRWYAGRSLGIDGRRDTCAAVIHADASGLANWVSVPDSSPQGMKDLLSSLPTDTRAADPTANLTPGTPVEAHPIRMHTGSDFNDCPHWLLPEHDATGHLVSIVDYVYDYPRQRVRFSNAGTIFPSDPRYSNPFPYLSVAQAITLLRQQRGVNALDNPAPELVFLPIDVGVPEQPGPAARWRGGGVWPSDPVWLLASSDGQDYVIGTDRHAYTPHDVPLS